MPAVSIKKQLEYRGYVADIICLEDLYSGRDEIIEKTKKSLHKNFRMARMSYRLPTRNKSAIDPELEKRLIERLSDERYDRVIVFSGFWLDFMNRLMTVSEYYRGRVYAIHMDASYSLSWKAADRTDINEIWLYNLDRGAVEHMLEEPSVCETADKKLKSKESINKDENAGGRILVHGGGWGIGEYDARIETLNQLGYGLDIIIYYEDEYQPDEAGLNRYFLLDPAWKPDKNGNEYPRLLTYGDGIWHSYVEEYSEVNPLRQLMLDAVAVLSKPGGGTISDSFITATPLIFGDELATYEKSNMELWIDKGYGISFDDFVNAGKADKKSLDIKLERMRESIVQAQSGVPHVFDILLNE